MNRRSSISSSASSTASASAKRPAATDSANKFPAASAEQSKKRVALQDITSKIKAGRINARPKGANGLIISAILNPHMIYNMHEPTSFFRFSQKSPSERSVFQKLPNSLSYTSVSMRDGDQNKDENSVVPSQDDRKPNAANSASTLKKRSINNRDARLNQSSAITSAAVKPYKISSSNTSSLQVNNGPKPTTVPVRLAPCSTLKSPNCSRDSVSLVETMSTCDSMKSPDFEYIDNGDSAVIASLERRAKENLNISEYQDSTGSQWRTSVPTLMEVDIVIDVDTNHDDPQFCTTFACDIYKHLRASETKKRPSIDFMETIQKDINASMRSILVDWLVEVSEEYRLVPETLYLTVSYIDRYLSGNEMNRQRLQLLGVACMLIAAKYEEICAPQVEEFCYITDNTYFKDEVLQMESDVLKYLKFEVTTPTAKCFLRRFIRAAQGSEEVPALQLEFLANYIAELSLLEYNMLCYKPSVVAASAIFLANFILQPTSRPWNATLSHYTLYNPSELSECVKALHGLVCASTGNNLPAIREKYSQHKYKFVAKKYCPASIPLEFFQDSVN